LQLKKDTMEKSAFFLWLPNPINSPNHPLYQVAFPKPIVIRKGSHISVKTGENKIYYVHLMSRQSYPITLSDYTKIWPTKCWTLTTNPSERKV